MSEKKEVLLKIRDLKIEGYSDETWVPIIKGVDLTLHRGEVLGLIGESGAGKSTIGARRHGLCPRRHADLRRLHRVRRDGTDHRVRIREARASGLAHRLCGAVGAAAFNPAHKLIDQHTEAPVHYRIQKPDGGPGRCHGALRAPAAARTRPRIGVPLSPPGLGRPAAAGDDRDGHVLPSGSDHLRRADHGARRDHPDRGAGRDPGHRGPVQHGRDLHHPRPRGGGADGGHDQGAPARQGGGGGRPPRRCWKAPRRTTPSRSGRSAASSARRRTGPPTGRRSWSVEGVDAAYTGGGEGAR